MIKYSWLVAIGLSLCAACDLEGNPTGPSDPSDDGGGDGLGSNSGGTTGWTTGSNTSAPFPEDGGFGSGGCNGGGISGTNGGPLGVPFPINLSPTPVVASRPPPALSGGTLSISPDGKFAVAADPDRDKIFVVELATGTARTIELARGAEPGRVAFDGAGRAHVALRSGAALAQIDLATATRLRQTPICEFPRGVAYNGTSDAMVVACASGDVVTVAAGDHTEISRSFVELDLRDVLITKDQRILVTTFRNSELIELNPDGKIARRGSPSTSSAQRLIIDPQTCGAEFKDVKLRPRIAWRAKLDSNGQPQILHQRAQVEEVKLSSPGGYGGGSCSSVTETTIDGVALDGTSQAGWNLFATTALDFSTSPNGQWLAVASAGGFLHGRGTLQVYSSFGVTPPGGSGGCMGPFAELATAAQVTSVAFAPSGELIAFSREPAQLHVYTVTDQSDAGWNSPVITRNVQLDSESVRDTGHDLFHADVGGGIACASCHPEGRDDAHVWTFEGIGPRRSQTMGGGLSGTEPFHWDGDMTHFQHLVDQVMTGRMGEI